MSPPPLPVRHVVRVRARVRVRVRARARVRVRVRAMFMYFQRPYIKFPLHRV